MKTARLAAVALSLAWGGMGCGGGGWTDADTTANVVAAPVGQIVDKLVLALHRCFDSEGKIVSLTCVNGEVCRFGRKDGPEVL